jgi:hypothetical protein
MRDISDRKLIDLARLAQDLPSYRKKELAILIMSNDLEPVSVKRLAKGMVALSEDDVELEMKERGKEKEEELNKQHEWKSRQDEEVANFVASRGS